MYHHTTGLAGVRYLGDGEAVPKMEMAIHVRVREGYQVLVLLRKLFITFLCMGAKESHPWVKGHIN